MVSTSASLNGVSFSLENSSIEEARHVVEYPVPFQNGVAITDDFGKKPSPINITGYIAGEYSHESSKRLARVLQNATPKNPARLIHPQYGMKKVYPKEYTISDTLGQRRKTTLTMALLEVPENDSFFSVVENTLKTIEELKGKVFDLFDEVLTFARMPNYLLSEASDLLGEVASLAHGPNGFGAIEREKQHAKQTSEQAKAHLANIAGVSKKIRSDNRATQLQPFESTMEMHLMGVLPPPKKHLFCLQKGGYIDEIRQKNRVTIQSIPFHAFLLQRLQHAEGKGYLGVEESNDCLDVLQKLRKATLSHAWLSICTDYKQAIDAHIKKIERVKVDHPTDLLALCKDIYNDPEKMKTLLTLNKIHNPFDICPGEIYAIRANNNPRQ